MKLVVSPVFIALSFTELSPDFIVVSKSVGTVGLAGSFGVVEFPESATANPSIALFNAAYAALTAFWSADSLSNVAFAAINWLFNTAYVSAVYEAAFTPSAFLIKSANKSLFGFNLKSTNALTNVSYASLTSSCIAFSFANTSLLDCKAAANGSQVEVIYSSATKSSTLATKFSNNDLSPLIKLNICIACAKRSNEALICSSVTSVDAKIFWASVNAALNSLTTAGTTLAKSSSVIWLATSTAIANNVLSGVIIGSPSLVTVIS